MSGSVSIVTQEGPAIDRIVDQVWSRALMKIMKGGAVASSRAVLGDDIDRFVPQSVTGALLNANPAFAKLLYTSGYTSAKRNAYFIVRRLGMPADFFWKFDYWTDDRAFKVLQGVLGRIFASLMSKQKQGHLLLVSVDVESCAFQVSFASCVECSGQISPNPLCCFHAGVFAGIFAAMLDRDMDAYEEECPASGGQTCKFTIGVRDARPMKMPFDDWLDRFSSGVDIVETALKSLAGDAPDSEKLVDIGYYQLLVSSCFLPHAELFEGAYHAAGVEIGHRLAPILREGLSGPPWSKIEEFYRLIRHMSVSVSDLGQGLEVSVSEAPEAHGALEDNPLTAFIYGELESLLSDLTDRELRHEGTNHEPDGLRIRFAPQVR